MQHTCAAARVPSFLPSLTRAGSDACQTAPDTTHAIPARPGPVLAVLAAGCYSNNGSSSNERGRPLKSQRTVRPSFRSTTWVLLYCEIKTACSMHGALVQQQNSWFLLELSACPIGGCSEAAGTPHLENLFSPKRRTCMAVDGIVVLLRRAWNIRVCSVHFGGWGEKGTPVLPLATLQ